MISAEDKQRFLDLISEACVAGARRVEAAKLLGLTIRNLQRWEKMAFPIKERGLRYTPESIQASYKSSGLLSSLIFLD